MLPINCPLERTEHRNYLRCVNKKTLSYVDIPVARGLNVIKDLWLIVLNADVFSGNTNRLISKTPIKYDYACFVSINKDGSLYESASGIGFYKRGSKKYSIYVDLNTNKIIKGSRKIL